MKTRAKKRPNNVALLFLISIASALLLSVRTRWRDDDGPDEFSLAGFGGISSLTTSHTTCNVKGDPCWFPKSPVAKRKRNKSDGGGKRLDGSNTPFHRCEQQCGRSATNPLVAQSCDLMAKQYLCSNRGIRHPITKRCHCHTGWKGNDCSEEVDTFVQEWKTKIKKHWRAAGEQDRLVSEVFFPGKRDGVFLEAGATVSSSNTAFFEIDMNWRGICIAPLKKTRNEIEKNRPRCTTLPVCLWDASERLKITNTAVEGNAKVIPVFDRSPGSLQKYLDERPAKKDEDTIIEVQCESLENVMRQTNFTHINYLSLDVEGAELEVLRRFPFGKDLTIDVISVEMGSARYVSVAHFLLAFGFEYVGYDARRDDAIYVSPQFIKELAQLGERKL